MNDSQTGQGLVEYSLILLFVAIVVIIVVGIFGMTVNNMFSNVVKLI